MYLQDKPSTPPSEELSGGTEEATNLDKSTYLIMVHKSLSHETQDSSDCQVNSHHTYSIAHKYMRILQKMERKLNVVGIGNHVLTDLSVVTAAYPFQSSSGKVVCNFPEYDYLEVFKTQVDEKSIKVGEQSAEDRGKSTRHVVLKKRIHVVKYNYYGVDKFTCLTHQGQLGYHTNTVYKHNLSMLLTQLPCSFTSTFYPGSRLPALLDHTFAGYLFLFRTDAHGKTSLL